MSKGRIFAASLLFIILASMGIIVFIIYYNESDPPQSDKKPLKSSSKLVQNNSEMDIKHDGVDNVLKSILTEPTEVEPPKYDYPFHKVMKNLQKVHQHLTKATLS